MPREKSPGFFYLYAKLTEEASNKSIITIHIYIILRKNTILSEFHLDLQPDVSVNPDGFITIRRRLISGDQFSSLTRNLYNIKFGMDFTFIQCWIIYSNNRTTL